MSSKIQNKNVKCNIFLLEWEGGGGGGKIKHGNKCKLHLLYLFLKGEKIYKKIQF